MRVTVDRAGAGGPEARARDARYAALDEARLRHCADAVLLGHTRDDQAEQVLLGLARGSGARSLAGMAVERDGVRRPFLRVTRETTRSACAAQGIEVWDDPHNDDPRYLRVRARRLLTAVERELPGVAAALARSADLLRDDADALDEIAAGVRAELGESPWAVAAVVDRPVAVRRRLWRILITEAGVAGGALSSTHLRAVDDLAARWHGQGPVDLPGGLRARRLADPHGSPSRRARTPDPGTERPSAGGVG
ncbi:hypothetical protein GCM10025883_04060 [Mobilicoccus caccae]|uniref:tRNA(Ile)-lysidine synthetase n=1 Tax=Mobilicoccus caccae TaxID=1859295 RepID=A0ABQ6ILQ0_9MICO|nr:hypothetical protein GCM10025883_04060 [Mobilicoccus caccae]